VTADVTADDVERSCDVVDGNETAATCRRLSCAATSFIASTGSRTRRQPAASQLGVITEPPPLLLMLLLLLMLTSADDDAILAAPADITATYIGK